MPLSLPPVRRTLAGAPVLALALGVLPLAGGCGHDGDTSPLRGRWAAQIPEDSLTFHPDGKVSGGSTWPCTGTSTKQGAAYQLDLDCGGWGQVIMTAKLRDATTLELTDHDGQLHILRKQGTP